MDGEMKFLQQQRYDCRNNREYVHTVVGQNHLMAEPNRQIEHHADHGGCDAGQRRLKPLIAGHGLYERSAGEDEEKAGQKGDWL